MRLVLGDDHQMFLEALSLGLSRRGHVVLDASNELDRIAGLVDRHRPDACVLDLDFDGRSVLGPAAAIRRSNPGVIIVLLSGASNEEVQVALESRSVDGVVDKLCDLSVLERTIQRIAAGERTVRQLVPRPRQEQRWATELSRLSSRERTVLGLLVDGASTSQMSAELGISPHTVRSHVQSVLNKLGVSTRGQAADMGSTMGIGGGTVVSTSGRATRGSTSAPMRRTWSA